MEAKRLNFEDGYSFSRTRIEDLPDDLMVMIFQKLDQYEIPKKLNFKAISCVSKRWYSLANISRTNLTVSGFKASKMKKILSRFCNINILNLSFLFDCNEDVLSTVGFLCPYLKEIQISDNYKPDNGGSGLAALASGCPNLEVLSVHGFKGSEESLVSIGLGCANLRSLRLRSAAALNDSVVEIIVSNCKKIEDLDISFTDLTDASLFAIGSNLKVLSHLDLKHNKRVTGRGISFVARGCPLLQVLHLGVVNVEDEGLSAIGLYSKNLVELYLDYGSSQWGVFAKESMATIATGCRNLKLLSLRGSKQVDDGVLHGFSHGMPSLLELDLHACQSVTDTGMHSVIRGCRQIQNLSLTGTGIGTSGHAAFNGGLPNLKSLRLNNDNITDEVLKSLSVNCTSLEELFLANCSRLGDQGVEYLLQGCKKLRMLTIKSSPLVTGTGFSVDSPSLESLVMPSCGITDEGLDLIVAHCKALAHLSVSGCLEISAEGLVRFISNATSLREIVIVGCSQLSKEQVISVAKASRPTLKSMRVSRPKSPEDEYTIKRMHGGWVLPNWARH